MTGTLSHEGSHVANETTRVVNKSNGWSKNWMVSLKFHWNGDRHIEEVSIGDFLERSKHHSDWYWTRCRKGSHDGQHKAGSLGGNGQWFQCLHYTLEYSSFTKLWQSFRDSHLKIRPIAILVFYSLNYSLAARLQNNSRPKSPTKVETKRKLQQFTVSRWLIMNGGESGNGKKNVKAEITFNMKLQHNY